MSQLGGGHGNWSALLPEGKDEKNTYTDLNNANDTYINKKMLNNWYAKPSGGKGTPAMFWFEGRAPLCGCAPSPSVTEDSPVQGSQPDVGYVMLTDRSFANLGTQ